MNSPYTTVAITHEEKKVIKTIASVNGVSMRALIMEAIEHVYNSQYSEALAQVAKADKEVNQ